MDETCCLQQDEGYGVHIDEGQAIKSARGMPWHQEPTKDVTSCDKPRGGANIRYIRGFPNGGTRLSNTQASCIESNRCTRGTV